MDFKENKEKTLSNLPSLNYYKNYTELDFKEIAEDRKVDLYPLAEYFHIKPEPANPRYIGKNFDPFHKFRNYLRNYEKTKNMNPNYKGKIENYDPNYQAKKNILRVSNYRNPSPTHFIREKPYIQVNKKFVEFIKRRSKEITLEQLQEMKEKNYMLKFLNKFSEIIENKKIDLLFLKKLIRSQTQFQEKKIAYQIHRTVFLRGKRKMKERRKPFVKVKRIKRFKELKPLKKYKQFLKFQEFVKFQRLKRLKILKKLKRFQKLKPLKKKVMKDFILNAKIYKIKSFKKRIFRLWNRAQRENRTDLQFKRKQIQRGLKKINITNIREIRNIIQSKIKPKLKSYMEVLAQKRLELADNVRNKLKLLRNRSKSYFDRFLRHKETMKNLFFYNQPKKPEFITKIWKRNTNPLKYIKAGYMKSLASEDFITKFSKEHIQAQVLEKYQINKSDKFLKKIGENKAALYFFRKNKILQFLRKYNPFFIEKKDLLSLGKLYITHRVLIHL